MAGEVVEQARGARRVEDSEELRERDLVRRGEFGEGAVRGEVLADELIEPVVCEFECFVHDV